MFVVKHRSELIRFGLFLLIVGVMAYFVATKAAAWRETMTQPIDEPDPTPAAESPFKTGPELVAEPDPSAGKDYFAVSRMDRMRERSARAEQLMNLINNPNIDAEVKKKAAEELHLFQRLAAQEDRAERSVRDLGMKDVLVNLTGTDAVVSVRSDAPSQTRAMQVQETVAKVTGVRPAMVTVRFRD